MTPGVIGKKAGSEVTKFVEHPTAPALMFKQTLLGPNDTELHKSFGAPPAWAPFKDEDALNVSTVSD